jgi:Spy/CpxP family protein refolding chaperone
MGRANAIVVGSAVLAPLILGIEGYALLRQHHRPTAAEMTDLPAAAAPTPLSLVAAPPPAAPPAADPMPPPQPETPPETAPGPAEAHAPTTLAQQRELVVHEREIVQQADEKVFESLSLTDAQRAAIRAIDDQYVRTVQSIESSGSAATGVDLNANHTRRTAIGNVLGTDGLHAFISQELRAERRVRREFRAQMSRGQ